MPKPTIGMVNWGDDLNDYLENEIEPATIAGDAGDIKATVGAVVTNVKPGRIDARVRGLSTAATQAENVTVLDALVTEAAANGAELWIPEGDYAGYLTTAANLRANGRGKLKRNTSGHTVIIGAGADDVDLSGFTIDGVSGGGGISVAADRTHIHDLTITGISAATGGSPYTRGVSAASPTDGLRVERVGFYDVSTGVLADRPINARIIDNYGDGFAGNFITLWITDTPASDRTGNWIARNHGTGLERMLVEVFTTDGEGRYPGVYVVDNTGEWDVPDGTDQIGISMVRNDNAFVLRNRLIKLGVPTTAPAQPGVELVDSPGATIAYNFVQGFANGVMAEDSPRSRITNNNIWYCLQGIRSEGESPDLSIGINQIHESRDGGIILDNPTGEGYVGADIWRNLIRRSVAWTGDAARTFAGITHGSLTRDIAIDDNRIQLIQTTPTLSNFYGLSQNGTASTGVARARRNRIRTTSTSPFGRAFQAGSNLTSITNYWYEDNELINLANGFNFGMSAADSASIFGTGNVTTTVTTPNISGASGLLRRRVGILTNSYTLDFGSVAAGATLDSNQTFTGVIAGDTLVITPPAAFEAGMLAFAFVTADNSIRIRLANLTGSPVDPASGSYRVTAFKAR